VGNSATGITFDLWQTLIFEVDGYPNSKARRTARTERVVSELASHGVDLDPDTVRQAFTDLSAEITSGHDHGHDRQFESWVSILIERLVPGFEERAGASVIARIAEQIDMTFVESPPLLIDGCAQVLDELSFEGHKIGLISNTGLTSPEMYRSWFADIGILDYFDFLAFSNQQEISKPEARIFTATIEELEVVPERALHVGDNLHTDIGGAAAIGMSTAWVKCGISSPVEPMAEPDYIIESILELTEIARKWSGKLANQAG